MEQIDHLAKGALQPAKIVFASYFGARNPVPRVTTARVIQFLQDRRWIGT